jgi:hypothetical protein
MNTNAIVRSLLESDEPAIRFKIRTGYLGEDPNSRSIRKLREEVRRSPLVAALLQRRGPKGDIRANVYAKWQGPHWAMATLADIGYPTGDESLAPIRDQLQQQWLGKDYYREFDCESKSKVYGRHGVPRMQGRYRRCASQQSNALWSILKLELADERTPDFVERLLHWQWPDGGWNCDKNPDARHSSFMETILPLRALAQYASRLDHDASRNAAKRAAEIFLARHMYQRRSDRSIIHPEFVQLHYPLYWHYDVLHGLKVMAEAGFIHDKRCEAALDLLASKQLADGGWPAERRYYKAGKKLTLGNDYVDWGGTSKKKMNPWVTADALFVLKTAGYLA